MLVRQQSIGRLQATAAALPGGDRIVPLPGDLTQDKLGVTAAARRRLRGKVDHVVHLAALYDMTAGEERNDEVNVEGTRRVVQLAEDLQAGCLHHVSSVAVAGEAAGHLHRGHVRRGAAAALAVPPHEVRRRADRARDLRGAVAGLPALDRARGLPHRRDGQDRRAVLLLPDDRLGRRAAGGAAGSARAATAGRLQRGAGRLRRRRDGRPDPPGRARPAGLPPGASPAAAARRRLQRLRARRRRAPGDGARFRCRRSRRSPGWPAR